MASAPPRVHRAAKEDFTIPQEFYFDLLPSPMLSIAKMVDFTVPFEAIPNDVAQPLQFFSQAAPDRADKDTILRLRRLPIPQAKIIRKLVAGSRQASLDGSRSLMYSHLSESVVTQFPLWVLTYWAWTIDFKRDIRGRWVMSSDWVAQTKKSFKRIPKLTVLVDETRHILSLLPWGWEKPPGLSDSEPVHKLWRFLGPHWLSDSQQTDMLELLRHTSGKTDLARLHSVGPVAVKAKETSTLISSAGSTPPKLSSSSVAAR
ncbi:hypothetical protein C8R46DRAFT_1229543 [Mycena filopes]|nr:hypothetical protein C8R46DRAFT_1229543 [Mycena filopes]